MIDDHNFWQSIRVTLTYTVLAVPLYQVAGLALALLLNQRVRGMYLFRTILFLPAVLSGVAVAACGCTPQPGPRHREPGPAGRRRRRPASMAVRAPIGPCPPSCSWASGEWAAARSSTSRGSRTSLPPCTRRLGSTGPEHGRRSGTSRSRSSRPTLLFTLLIGLIEAFQVFDTAFVLGGSRGGTRGSMLVLRAQYLERGIPERPVRLRFGARVGVGARRRGGHRPDLRHVEPVGLLRVGGGLARDGPGRGQRHDRAAGPSHSEAQVPAGG